MLTKSNCYDMTHEESTFERPPPYNPVFLDAVSGGLILENSRKPAISIDDGHPPVQTTENSHNCAETRRPNSLRVFLFQVRRMTSSAVKKAKEFEEKHQLGEKTKRAASHSWKGARKAASGAAKRAQAFHEVHRPIEKSKRRLSEGVAAIKHKFRSSAPMSTDI